MPIALKTPAGGSVILSPANTATDVTVTVPAVSGALLIAGGAAGDLAGVTSVNGGQLAGLRNRIINGDMRIDQRNSGAATTPTSGQYTVDRFGSILTVASKFSFQQITGTNALGFGNYLNLTSLSAYSVLAGDTFGVFQAIEGINVQDFAFGTASAKPITLSFWALSNVTGTHSGAFINTASATRSYPFTFSIPSSGAWTKITVSILGDTAGTWNTGAGTGLGVRFNMGSGSTFSSTAGTWQTGNFVGVTGAVSVVGTNGGTLNITQVQLELGTVATPFEQRLIGLEQMLCARYLPVMLSSGGNNYYTGLSWGAGSFYVPIPFLVEARVPPTGVVISSAISTTYSNGASSPIGVTGLTFFTAGKVSALLQGTVGSGLTAGQAGIFSSNLQTIYFTGCEL